jgi:type I restriction enzyme S subunit
MTGASNNGGDRAVHGPLPQPSLPQSWRWARVGEVCITRTENRDPRTTPDSSFRYVDISSVDNQRKFITEARVMVGKDAPSRARQVIRANDVLVATTRPSLNAVALVPAELDGEICSTGFCVLRPGGEIDPEYLFTFVQTRAFVTGLSDLVKGALYPAVTDGQVRAQKLPLPPLREQRRIAARLREQLAEVEKARIAVQAQLNTAALLPGNQLRAVFASATAKGWPRCKLGDVLRLRKEVVHPRDNPRGPATFVGLEHIQPLTGARTGSLPIEMSDLTGRKPRFHTGDIVYGYLRPYLNKLWVAEFDGLCSVDQYVYEVNRDRAETDFVAWFMRSPIYLERAPVDETPGWLPRIRTEEVASVEINLPRLAQQRQVVASLKLQLGEAAVIKNSISARLAALETLPAALLREAFAGRL